MKKIKYRIKILNEKKICVVKNGGKMFLINKMIK